MIRHRGLLSDWDLIGAREPYFGVLSAPEFRGEIEGEALEKFYATGRGDIERLRAWCLEDLGTAPGGGRALDIGCGVGRLTFAMADHAREVVGYDISAPMLARARERASAIAASNITLTDNIPDGPFDWINSYIVFQHIPPPAGLALMQETLAQAAPGAITTLQVTLWRDARAVRPARLAGTAGAAFSRLRARAGFAPAERLIRMHDYNLSDVLRVLVEAGFARACLRHVDHAGHHGVWILARRSA